MAAPERPHPDATGPRRSGSTLGQRVLVLTFLLGAFAIFAAAVLLPLLSDYSRLLNEEQLLRAQVARLEDKRDQLVQLAANITDDPPTSERLARIELGYQRPGETIVPVEPVAAWHETTVATNYDVHDTIVPAHWPDWARAAEHWAQPRGLIAPFLDRDLQAILMLLAGGLLVAAFVLFAPRRQVAGLFPQSGRIL